MARIKSRARHLRFEYASRLGRSVTVEEAGTAMGISRKRLTSLELGKFDEITNAELIAFCSFYSKELGRPINVSDVLEYDPINNRRGFQSATA